MTTASRGSKAQWPEYLVERASQAPPDDCCVVVGSTPVVSFGHPLNPEITTLGINPSSSEFIGRNRRLLSGDKRRLATLESLGVSAYSAIDGEHATQIVSDCATYFERQPYHWFNVLNQILSQALGVSFYAKTASHLDLVQWATEPVWQGLSDVTRARLLSGDRPFLVRQLRHESYRLMVVAGRTALEWVKEAGLVRWQPVARLEGRPAATFYVGDTPSPRFVGWSCNLQSQPGARRHIPRLVEFLGRFGDAPARPNVTLDSEGFIPKGTHFRTRTALTSHLEEWLQRSTSPTIGDVSRFPRRPWISFESSAGLVDLNADTRRDAIERMIEYTCSNPSAAWHVVQNSRGSVNKVTFDPEDPNRGWYCYLRTPLREPTTI